MPNPYTLRPVTAEEYFVAERGGRGAHARRLLQHLCRSDSVPDSVSVLAERRFGTFDGLARQLPIGVEPIGIADHHHDPVFAITGREILGNFRGEVFGWHSDFIYAAFDLLLSTGGGGCVTGGCGL